MRAFELLGFALGIYFWLQMLRSCLAHEPRLVERLAWLAFMLVFPVVGSLVYFFVRTPLPRA